MAPPGTAQPQQVTQTPPVTQQAAPPQPLDNPWTNMDGNQAPAAPLKNCREAGVEPVQIVVLYSGDDRRIGKATSSNYPCHKTLVVRSTLSCGGKMAQIYVLRNTIFEKCK